MPRVLNGFGTWYWGKTNLRTRRGTCEFCRRTGDLRSYDTTLFLVGLFVPLIPLGERRIFSECPYCKRHRAAKMKKWVELRDRTVGEAVAAYLAAPRDPAKAEAAVGAAASFDSDQHFLQIAPVIASSLASNPASQATLAAGYSAFGYMEEAEAAYLRSLKARPDPEVSESLALFYLKQSRPADAERCLQHLLSGQHPDKVPFLSLAVEGYQANGEHERALALLDAGARAYPGLQSDATWARYRETSLRNRASGRRIRSPGLAALITRRKAGGVLSIFGPRLFAPALLLVAFCIYLSVSASEGASRTVWFVNGLDKPYELSVNGRRLQLGGLSSRPIEVAEGDVAVDVLDPALAIAPQHCRVTTPLLARPMLNRTFVINPDHAAIVYDEESTYSDAPVSSGAAAGTNPHHLHVGELLYTLSGIDYVFSDFPASIKMDSHGSVNKRRVAMVSKSTPLVRLMLVQKELGPQAMASFARAYAAGASDDPQFLGLLAMLLKPEEALAIVRPKLAVRPVLVEWHRAYQELADRALPEHDLATEYRALLAAAPSDTALAYLSGRATDDRAEARRLFLQAAQGEPPIARGYFALAFDGLATADFASALDCARKAQQISPADHDSRAYEMDALTALGRTDELLGVLRQDEANEPADGDLVIQEIITQAHRGRVDEAHAAADRYIAAQLRPASGGAAAADESRQWNAYANAALSYACNDLEAYGKAMASISDRPDLRFPPALAAGNLEDAAAALAESKSAAPDEHLLLYLLAEDIGKTDLTRQQFQAALSAYGKGNKEDRRLAHWLSDPATANADQACTLAMQPDRKRIVLLAMARIDRKNRQRYQHLAAQLNFNPTFPYWTIKKLLSADAAPQR